MHALIELAGTDTMGSLVAGEPMKFGATRYRVLQTRSSPLIATIAFPWKAPVRRYTIPGPRKAIELLSKILDKR